MTKLFCKGGRQTHPHFEGCPQPEVTKASQKVEEQPYQKKLFEVGQILVARQLFQKLEVYLTDLMNQDNEFVELHLLI